MAFQKQGVFQRNPFWGRAKKGAVHKRRPDPDERATLHPFSQIKNNRASRTDLHGHAEVVGQHTLQVLGADRALTLDEVCATVAPLADYLTARKWPIAGGLDLTDRPTVERSLGAESFAVAVRKPGVLIRVIGMDPHQLVTEGLALAPRVLRKAAL